MRAMLLAAVALCVLPTACESPLPPRLRSPGAAAAIPWGCLIDPISREDSKLHAFGKVAGGGGRALNATVSMSRWCLLHCGRGHEVVPMHISHPNGDINGQGCAVQVL